MIAASRHIATRETTTQPATQQQSSSFFDMLHPHLRNVPAACPTALDEIHAFLQRRGTKTGEQISAKVGLQIDRVRFLMRHDTQKRFKECRGDSWEAQEGQPAATDKRPLSERIVEYLTEHGPATIRMIAVGLGVNESSVESVMSRGTSGAIWIRDPEKARGKLWKMP